ncbi:MAG: hypothetical protein ACLFWL_06465 [Candidatus Brocadiia bacterium]
MRRRTIGKIVIGVLAIALAILTFNYIHKVGPGEQVYEGFRAIAFAILSLTATTAYRYFED